MEFRLLDLVCVLLLLLLFCTSGGLLLYAVGSIGMRVMRALHVFFTCWDYQRACRRGDIIKLRILLFDPVMRGILRATPPWQLFCPVVAGRQRQLRRLEESRLEKLRAAETDLVWDDRLAVLLTRDEFNYLHGTQP